MVGPFLLALVSVCFAQTISPEWRYFEVGNLAGGMNQQLPPNLLQNNQAQVIENMLPRQGGLSPRYGYNNLNTTSMGGSPILSLCKFEKSTGWSQYLVAFNGRMWTFDDGTDEFSGLIKESAASDSACVTEASATVLSFDTELTGKFRDYGYEDSISVYLGDSLRYVKKILNDSLMELYTAWGGDTDSVVITLPFQVSDVRPTQMTQWMNNLYIPGIRRLSEYDGESAILQPATKVRYNVSAIEAVSSQLLKLTCTPNREKGNQYFNTWYLSYEDDATDVNLNVPLQIQTFNESGSNSYFYLNADSSLVNHVSTAAWDSVWLIPSLVDIDTVATVIIDSVNHTSITTTTLIYKIYDYSVLPSEDSLKYNFGFYCFEGTARSGNDVNYGSKRHPVRARVDANDSAYFYTIFYHASSGDTLVAGDTVYLVRCTEGSSQTDVAQYMAIWRDRAFYSGYIQTPAYVEYSEAFDPDSFLSYNYVYVDKDDGDEITGLFVLNDDLQVPKRNHLYKFIGIPNVQMQLVTVSGEVGVSAPHSVVTVGREAFFFHYTGFYRYDGETPTKISGAIRPTVMDSINLDQIDKIVGGYFDDNVWWAYPSSGSGSNDRMLVYHPESNSWYKTTLKAGCFHVADNEQESRGVLFGDSDSGVVWVYGDTYQENGADLSCIYESPWIDMDTPLRKHFKDLYLAFDKNDSTQIFIDYYLNHSETVFASDTVTYDSQNFEVERRAMPAGLYGYALKMKMTATPAEDSLLLSGYQIKWKVLGDQQYDKE